MYLNAKENSWKAAMYNVIDLDTMDIIPHVLWANDETGEYAQFFCNMLNHPIFDRYDELIIEIKKGNIRLVAK